MGMYLKVLAILVLILALLTGSALFVVDQTETAIVLQLGKPVGGTRDPGLHVKIPLLQRVVLF
jgi:membrane protease subunit HflC